MASLVYDAPRPVRPQDILLAPVRLLARIFSWTTAPLRRLGFKTAAVCALTVFAVGVAVEALVLTAVVVVAMSADWPLDQWSASATALAKDFLSDSLSSPKIDRNGLDKQLTRYT